MPPKIWRPKVTSKYKIPEYTTDVYGGMFNYSDWGDCILQPSLKWYNTPCDDIIDFNKDNDISELVKGLKIGSMLDSIIQDQIIDIIKTYWGWFFKYSSL